MVGQTETVYSLNTHQSTLTVLGYVLAELGRNQFREPTAIQAQVGIFIHKIQIV